MTQFDAGPSRVPGAQRVRRRLARLSGREAARAALEAARALRLERELRRLQIHVARVLRLRTPAPAHAAWCADVFDELEGLIRRRPTVTVPTWLCDASTLIDALVARADAVLPPDRDPRPARTIRKR